MPEPSTNKGLPSGPGQHWFVAPLVLAGALAATAFATWREHELLRRDQQIRFDDGFTQAEPVINTLSLLKFGQLADLAKATLMRDQYSASGWQEFLKDSVFTHRFPGMTELGYAESTNGHWVVKYAAGATTAVPYPAGTELDREPAIQVAIQKSIIRGTGLPSQPLVPAHAEPPAPVVAGFILLPFIGQRPGTLAENQARVHGLIFFLLNQEKYFQSWAPQLAKMPLAYRLLAPDEPAPERLPTRRVTGLTCLSGEWRFVVTMKSPPVEAAATQWIVLAVGILLSGWLYRLFATQARLQTAGRQATQAILEREAEIQALNRGLEQTVAVRTAELERFRAVIEATSDLVAMAGLDGRTIYLNSAGRRMLEFPPELDPVGRPLEEYYPADVNRFFQAEAIPQAMREGLWTGETRMLTCPGRELPVSFVGLVIKDADGRPLHLACVARDITERKSAETRLQTALDREKELNRLKGNFVSMVTHEIRTPLAHIQGASDILSRYLDRLAPEKRTQHFGHINAAVRRMNALMEDVLLFSKAEAGRMEFHPAPLDLPKLCRQIADELRSATNRRCPIAVNLADVDAPARGDENLLRHIFTNLISNAVKYSPAGSTVTFSATRAGRQAVFQVHDRGLGIPEEDRQRLFTPFYRGKNVATLHGTGLGLVIVKHCVEQHGGGLEIESHENVGTTVWVRLPLFPPDEASFSDSSRP